MKRDRMAETEADLLAAKARLRVSLLAVLPEIAVSGASLFTNYGYNPHGFSATKLWSHANAFYEEALSCVATRTAMELPVENSPGYLFIAACE